ncbi:MAG: GspH/FimT family pseudopilin [Janthinobacterium lividum]
MNTGFTLVELMVVLAVLAIALATAAPGFTGFLRNAELTTAANSFVASVNAARSEAMKRNLPALVMPLDAARRDWSQGFVAFVDVDMDGAYTESVDITVLRQPISAPFLSVTGTGTAKSTPAYVRYDGSGFARTASGSFIALSMSFSRNDAPAAEAFSQTRRIFIARTGRIRMCTPASAKDARCELPETDS